MNSVGASTLNKYILCGRISLTNPLIFKYFGESLLYDITNLEESSEKRLKFYIKHIKPIILNFYHLLSLSSN